MTVKSRTEQDQDGTPSQTWPNKPNSRPNSKLQDWPIVFSSHEQQQLVALRPTRGVQRSFFLSTLDQLDDLKILQWILQCNLAICLSLSCQEQTAAQARSTMKDGRDMVLSCFFPMTWQEPSQTRTWWPRSACEHYSMKCQMIVQRPVTSGKVWSCCDRMSFGKLKGKFKRAQTDSNSKFGFSSSKGLESRTHIDQRVGCWSHETRSRIVDACWIMPLLPLAISWKQVKQYSALLVVVPSTLTPLIRGSIPLLTSPSPGFDFLLIQNLPSTCHVPSCPKLPVVKVLPHVRGLQATSACAHWLEAFACLVLSLLIHYSEAKAETQLAFAVYSCIQYTVLFLLE